MFNQKNTRNIVYFSFFPEDYYVRGQEMFMNWKSADRDTRLGWSNVRNIKADRTQCYK